MTIDHFTWTFFPGYRTDILTLALHIIGRLTAPIMCYFVVEGYYHTKNLKKYIIRMFVFALMSHFAYAFMFGKNFIPFKNSVFDQTSVMWTFALGLVALAVSKTENPKIKPWQKQVIIWICLIAAFCATKP
jgi:peptidoglycan/LPS O-acetylase OafA/YrhL